MNKGECQACRPGLRQPKEQRTPLSPIFSSPFSAELSWPGILSDKIHWGCECPLWFPHKLFKRNDPYFKDLDSIAIPTATWFVSVGEKPYNPMFSPVIGRLSGSLGALRCLGLGKGVGGGCVFGTLVPGFIESETCCTQSVLSLLIMPDSHFFPLFFSSLHHQTICMMDID